MTYSTSTSLETSGSESDSDVALVLKATFFSILIPLSIGGNLLVCITFCTDKRLKRVPSNYLIVSLAGADLLVSCVVMSFTLVTVLMRGEWIFGGEFCTILFCIETMCCNASILHLCAISLDRYFRIKCAVDFDIKMSLKQIGLISSVVWFLSALMSFIPIYLGLHKRPEDEASEHDDAICKNEINFPHAVVSCCISFFLPCIIMMAIYFKMFYTARSHAAQIDSHNTTPRRRRKYFIRENNVAFTMGITTGVFIICWSPLFISNVLVGWSSDLVPDGVALAISYVALANSCFNPVIYYVFNTQFRRAFQRSVCFRKITRLCCVGRSCHCACKNSINQSPAGK